MLLKADGAVEAERDGLIDAIGGGEVVVVEEGAGDVGVEVDGVAERVLETVGLRSAVDPAEGSVASGGGDGPRWRSCGGCACGTRRGRLRRRSFVREWRRDLFHHSCEGSPPFFFEGWLGDGYDLIAADHGAEVVPAGKDDLQDVDEEEAAEGDR